MLSSSSSNEKKNFGDCSPSESSSSMDERYLLWRAINYVKELEQLVQSLEARKRVEQRMDAAPFADFFTFPQYSTTGSRSANNDTADEGPTENRPAAADIEVTMVESHANLKVLSRKRPKQLLKMVLGLQNLRLTTLHLNVTSIAEMAFYSFSLKVERAVFPSVDGNGRSGESEQKLDSKGFDAEREQKFQMEKVTLKWNGVQPCGASMVGWRRRGRRRRGGGDGGLLGKQHKKANKEVADMALGKGVMALLIVAVVAAATVEQARADFDDPATCYCPCMKNECMTLDGATKGVCARACDKGCREASFSGQPNPFEFCGF
ncbi:hypothetical protein GW17_00034839 [Ensete ventricosum]|nr:hypothetical protein GW17_00034839 [Ensete ventricosum]